MSGDRHAACPGYPLSSGVARSHERCRHHVMEMQLFSSTDTILKSIQQIMGNI